MPEITHDIYLISSLKHVQIPQIANDLEAEGYSVFAEWYGPGPEADDFFKKYQKERNRTYKQALKSFAATHIFEFDLHHIINSRIGLLVMPCGKSGHLELGYMIGQGKPGIIYFPDGEPESSRWDLMLQFCFLTGGDICFSWKELLRSLKYASNRYQIRL